MSSVLIIDSEPTQLIALEAVIKGWGHSCQTARDATQARNCFEEDAFDVVLLDWGLPSQQGLDLLTWFKQHREGADSEVVIQSRREVPEDIRDAINRGAYYYLTRPYEWPQLRALIRAAEVSRELRGALEQAGMEVENVSWVGLSPRRSPEKQRQLAIGGGLFGKVIVDAEGMLSLVHKVLGHRAPRIRSDELHRCG